MWSTILRVGFFLGAASAWPWSRDETLERRVTYRVNEDRANAVKDAFLVAWDGYMTYAFPNDALLPVTNGFANPRNGWGASAIDALSTAIIMDLPDVVQTILHFVPTINYGYTEDPISLFETTIRYLGGMLAGYDLLTGPFANFSSNTSAIDALLAQSTNLANDLSFAFDTPSGIPDNTIYFTNRSLAGDDTNGLATIGTLVLEWTRLSDLTGNSTYAKLIQKAESYLLNPKPPSAQPFPGLVGTNVYLANGTFQDAAGGWVGGDDSFYEYLLKMYVYDSSRFSTYKDRWVLAADSSIKYLASHPSTRTDLTFLAEFNGTQLVYESEHLACFDGGSFLLGGLVPGEKQYIDFGLQLVAACHETYTATATGIGPEVFQWLPEACNNITSSQQKRDAYAHAYAEAASAADSPYHETPSGYSYPTTSPYQSPPSPYPTPTPNATTTGGNGTATSTSTSTGPTSTLVPPYSNCTIPPAYASQSSFYQKSGFWITNPTYDLRPEVLESFYYAYRITGNTMYQDWAWEAFQAINRTTRVGSGYSQINDVNVPGGGGFTNNQESFWFAEVLKYAYLIQAADGPWQVNYQGQNQFVFNTEAHPLKVKKVI